jgi:hypothetical protein
MSNGNDEIRGALAALRRDVDALRGEVDALRRAPGGGHVDYTDAFAEALGEAVTRDYEAKGSAGGFGVAVVVTQRNNKGHSGTSFGITTLDDAASLPTPEQIEQRIIRLAPFVQSPIPLRTLRCLAERYFEGKPMQRPRAEIAGSLGIGETDLEEALRPLFADDTLQRGLTPDGEPFYKWDGNGMPMVLLVNG